MIGLLLVCSVHLHRHTLTSADLPLYLHTPTHLHIYLYHLYIHTVTPSHPPSLSFFLSFFLHVLSLTCVDLHLDTLTSADLPLHLHTSVHLYRTCKSNTVTPSRPPSLSLLLYIFSLYFKLNFFATSYSITDCIKKSSLLDNDFYCFITRQC